MRRTIIGVIPSSIKRDSIGGFPSDQKSESMRRTLFRGSPWAERLRYGKILMVRDCGDWPRRRRTLDRAAVSLRWLRFTMAASAAMQRGSVMLVFK